MKGGGICVALLILGQSFRPLSHRINIALQQKCNLPQVWQLGTGELEAHLIIDARHIAAPFAVIFLQ